MPRGSSQARRRPTLGGMSTHRRTSWLTRSALLLGMPAALLAQHGSITATATVLPRPLSLIAVERTTSPGELLVRVVGCAAGTLTVDTRTEVTLQRSARVAIGAGRDCGPRSIPLTVAAGASTPLEFIVSLEQSDALLAPSVTQVVIPATVSRRTTRSALAY